MPNTLTDEQRKQWYEVLLSASRILFDYSDDFVAEFAYADKADVLEEIAEYILRVDSEE